MHYVYILRSRKDGKLYIGCTNNLKKPFTSHNKGEVSSTAFRRPFTLMHYEAFLNKSDAFAREQWLKTGWGKNYLKKTLYNLLESLGG